MVSSNGSSNGLFRERVAAGTLPWRACCTWPMTCFTAYREIPNVRAMLLIDWPI
jgi:hypothetical protein